MVRNLWPIWIMFFYVFFYNVVKVSHYLYHFIVLLHLISSFSLTGSLRVPYAYVSIKSIDCILSSSFELNAILLFSSVKTLCLSLLNLCCVFNIHLLFFMNSSWFFLTNISFQIFLYKYKRFLYFHMIPAALLLITSIFFF